MTCGNCGLTGHNRRTCGFTRPLPTKGSKKCSVCGKLGHNKRTCPTLLDKQFELEVAKVEQKFELELTCLLCDEEPMDSDVELTPTPREEVDVATEGYTGEPREICGLDHDVMLLVGGEVLAIRDKENRDYWEHINSTSNFRDADISDFRMVERIIARQRLFHPHCGWTTDGNGGFVPRDTHLDTIQDCRQDRRIEWVGECPAPESGNTWVKYVVDEIGDQRNVLGSCPQTDLAKGRNWDWKKVKCGKCGVFGHTARSTRFHPSEKLLKEWKKKQLLHGWIRDEMGRLASEEPWV